SQPGTQSSGVHRPQPSRQPRFVDRPNLLKENQATPAGKLDGNAELRWTTAGRHGHDYYDVEKIVDLGRRDDHAGAGFSRFPRPSWIDVTEPHLSALHHFKFSSASLPNSGQTSR